MGYRKLFSGLLITLSAAQLVGCGPETSTPETASEETAAAEVQATPAPPPAATSSLLNPDAADQSALTTVPHITPELADLLIAERPFADMLEVDALLGAGLDEAQREEVYGRLFRPLDLNSATEEEILLIPGVGDQMAHEFEEYRPYVGIEPFRREIGKYVDAAEVARLEQYVRIP